MISQPNAPPSDKNAVDLATPGRMYKRLGAVYPWASPTYVRDHMTEPMVISYLQEMNHVSEEMAKPTVQMLLEGVCLMLGAGTGRSGSGGTKTNRKH